MKTLREIKTWDEFDTLLEEGTKEDRENQKRLEAERKNDHKEWLKNNETE